MVSFVYDYSFLLKTIKYILLPVIAIVAIVGFSVFIYSRKSKKENIEKYNYIIDLWTTLIAIVVVSTLFAITLGFSLSLTNTIKSLDLIKGHEIIYYIVIATPILPFIFLLIYLYTFILTIINRPKEDTSQNKINSDNNININDTGAKEENNYDIDFTRFNEENSDKQINIEEEKNTENNEVLDEGIDNEEVLNLYDLSDDNDDQKEEEIELL